MKYFMIEGIIKNPDLINDDIMKEHMAYSKKAMDKGLILMAGLKSNMSGGLFIMGAETIREIEEYLDSEPLKVHGIQEYNIVEFDSHYVNKSIVNDLINN